jgi:hypothetical protein
VFGQKADRIDIYLLNACSEFLQQKQKTKIKIPQKHFIFGQVFLGSRPNKQAVSAPKSSRGPAGLSPAHKWV